VAKIRKPLDIFQLNTQKKPASTLFGTSWFLNEKIFYGLNKKR